MTPAQSAAWFRLSLDSWSLGLASARVISLRTARIAAGGTAGQDEAWRMLAEKWQAAAELSADLILAAPTRTPLATSRRAVSHLKRKVAANARRLG